MASAVKNLTVENPDADGIPAGFRVNPGGVFRELPAKEGADGPRLLRLCSELHVVADARDPEQKQWGRLIEFRDRDGEPHRVIIPLAWLAGSGEKAREVLLGEGAEVEMNREARAQLCEFILRAAPGRRARFVNKTGWHELNGGAVFVLPGATLGDAGREPVLFASELAEPPRFEARGTLAQWTKNVAAFAVGNPRLAFVVSVAFAAPLLHLLNDESRIFHLLGAAANASSSGKTTALRLAASVCGPPEYLHVWRQTDNALETVCEAHSDAPLILDDLGQMDPHAFGESVYMVGNNRGKGRSTRQGEGRGIKRWRTLGLSSGEVGIEDVLSSINRKARGGQFVRFVEVPADGGKGLGIFDALHGRADGAALSRDILAATAEFYGAAFPHWVETIIAKRAALVDTLRAVRAGFAAELLAPHAKPSGQVRRVADAFALVGVAGELAGLAGCTGWPDGEAKRAARVCFQAWVDRRGGVGAIEERAILEQVQRFFALHGEARFTVAERWERAADGFDTHAPRTSNRAGFVRHNEGGGATFFVFPAVFRAEVCAGFDASEGARVLLAHGILQKGHDRYTRKERLPGFKATKWVYVLTPEDVEPVDDEGAEP